MRNFERNNTIQFIAKFKTFSGRPINTDVNLPVITITNEVGTKVINAHTMSEGLTVGTYYALYTPVKDSVYVVEVSGTIQKRLHLARAKFRVNKTI